MQIVPVPMYNKLLHLPFPSLKHFALHAGRSATPADQSKTDPVFDPPQVLSLLNLSCIEKLPLSLFTPELVASGYVKVSQIIASPQISFF